MPLCTVCATEQAVSQIKILVFGLKVDINLCGKCNLIARPQHEPVPVVATQATGAICPACGLSAADVQTKGRLGCPNDYNVFRNMLVDQLDSYHGASTHAGKIPNQKAFCT